MTQVAQDKAFQSRMQQLDVLLEKVQTIADPGAREITTQIIQTMMEFHGAGLERIFEQLNDAGELGQSMIRELSEDDLVSGLLLLYGLHPLDLESRVRMALDKVRPYLGSHGGNVELLSISEDGAVYLQMQGSCHGCPSSALTLKNSIEQAILEKAPDVTAIHVAGVEEPAKSPTPVDGFVSIERVIASSGKLASRGFKL